MDTTFEGVNVQKCKNKRKSHGFLKIINCPECLNIYGRFIVRVVYTEQKKMYLNIKKEIII
jgi:hypothetical protein